MIKDKKSLYKAIGMTCLFWTLSACTATQRQVEPAVAKPGQPVSKPSHPIVGVSAPSMQLTDVTPEYTAGSSKFIANQIMIITRKGQTPFKLRDKQLKVEKITTLDELSITIMLVGFKSDKLDKNALIRKLNKLKTERPDLTIQPNFIYYVDGKESTKQDKQKSIKKNKNHRRIPQYALQLTGLTKSQNNAGKGVRIGLIDTPIDAKHEALKNASIKVFNLVQTRGKRHGTAIAGILVGQGRIQGVAPAANLISIGAFNEPHQSKSLGLSTSFVLGKAFNRALKEKVDVINLSFGSTELDPLMNMLAKETLSRHIILLASVGNDNHKTSVRYPAAIPGVYAITAIDAQSKIYKRANTGNPVDYALPGVGILTTKPNGKYTSVTGTSFANAYATGIFALQLSQKRALKMLNHKVLDLGASGKDNFFGLGLMRF